ncbi:MAG: hypothetical protein JWM80_3461 [Cyanobacteria bacterium RYN_339]|nr:hypothetical protein [Cyanobacteria bacterium RYN_339]
MAIEQRLVGMAVKRGAVERVGEAVGHGLGKAGHVAADGVATGARGAWHGMQWADTHGLDRLMTPARTDAAAEAIWQGTKGTVKGGVRAAGWVDAHGGSRVLTDARLDAAADGLWTGVKGTVKTVVGWLEALDRTAFGRGVGRGLEKAGR